MEKLKQPMMQGHDLQTRVDVCVSELKNKGFDNVALRKEDFVQFLVTNLYQGRPLSHLKTFKKSTEEQVAKLEDFVNIVKSLNKDDLEIANGSSFREKPWKERI